MPEDGWQTPEKTMVDSQPDRSLPSLAFDHRPSLAKLVVV